MTMLYLCEIYSFVFAPIIFIGATIVFGLEPYIGIQQEENLFKSPRLI